MVKDSTYYNTLALETNATQSEIRKAYKRLVKENPPNSDDTEFFTKVSEAFFVLSDPERRKEYDRQVLLNWIMTQISYIKMFF